MKKFLSVLLMVSIVMSTFAFVGFADSGKVEITFCVGDDTLSINGQDVKVEKPYVVGEGVTLVPLRVITEAFGAKVGWEDSTKTITLSYPDVEIILQIGNPVAEVNKKAVTLLAAPELPGDSTMVPLRFISETFGAVVGYDEKTERISVTKENKASEGSTVQGAVNSKKIGDSYYGWSMDNPADMTMSERNFDGSFTEFAYDDKNQIAVFVTKKDENYTFDKYYIDLKDSFSKLTLVKADRNVSDENKKTAHFQAKNKDTMFEMHMVDAGGEYFYEISSAGEISNKQYTAAFSAIIASFDNTFNAEDTHDLSNVKDGYRKYESEELNISFDVPADFFLSTLNSATNEVRFYKNSKKDTYSYIYLGVYSSSQVGTAEELAKKDFGYKKENYNKDITVMNTHLTKHEYANIMSYEYECEVKSVYNHLFRDTFFQVGDYVYNMAIGIKNYDSDTRRLIDIIMNSVKAEPIDAEKMGVLMRNDMDYEGEAAVKGNGWTITIPNSYEYAKQDNSLVFQDRITGSAISVIEQSAPINNAQQLKATLENILMQAKGKGAKVVDRVNSEYIGKISCTSATYNLIDGDDSRYVNVILGIHQGKLFVISIIVEELVYSEKEMTKIRDVLKTIKFE